MQKTALPLTISSAEKNSTSAPSDGLGHSQLSLFRFAEGWLLDGEIRQHSAATLSFRRLLTEKKPKPPWTVPEKITPTPS